MHSRQRVVIVGMIYKSVDYLKFMLHELHRSCPFTAKFFVANDATQEVKDELFISQCNWIDYQDPKPDDYYLNRVYRAWNMGGFLAPGDIIVFVNSDMAYSPCWLENLLAHLDPCTIPVSRLVESGKMRSGKHAISLDFGRSYQDYNREAFQDYAKQISNDKAMEGGLYMPCAFYKDDFIAMGGYPEGNVDTNDGVVTGDAYLFNKSGKKHMTVFNSIVYHIQEGEMDE